MVSGLFRLEYGPNIVWGNVSPVQLTELKKEWTERKTDNTHLKNVR